MAAIYSRINREHVLFTDALEKLTGRVLCILELIDEHRAAGISQFVAQVVLIRDLASLEIIADHAVLIILVDEKHARLIVMKHHVRGFEHVSSLIANDWQVHQVLQTVLVGISLFLLSVLVDLDNGSIYDEGTVVGHGLKTLTVLAVPVLRLQVLVKPRLFSFVVLVPVIHGIDVLQLVLVLIFILVILVVAQLVLASLHVYISPIADDLRFKPRVVGSLVATVGLAGGRLICACFLFFEHLLRVHLDEALCDGATHGFHVLLIHQIEDPGRYASIWLHGADPHQQLILAIELDHRIGLDSRATVRILARLVNHVQHILRALLLLSTHFVNAKEQALLHGDVLTSHSIILE